MSRTGKIFIRIIVSLFFAIFSIILVYGFVQAVGWRDSTRLALLPMLAVSLVLPVWFKNSSMQDKVYGVILSIGGGLVSIGVAAALLNNGYLLLGSLLQAGAMGVSAWIGYSWLRLQQTAD